ncbi:3-deoxy-7-phosphoheptulonate synthase [Leptonema illini]|uniref:Phospho-2-dehydro-3-deoxyheptonate aldolase n=1 Tax=Leptonema illini DSM 21528 TaxID=929563 RepID=H2CGX4_9LEPT|nr:3-deoxy-7-phosphoheptulonate synthase [Leptonema illini]EHQ05816.1 3-deoxy-D-arabinoheptulosonate-7-phosphate synthase [Leptonema illini DSM 21528]
MLRTQNLRIRELTPIISPYSLKQVFPLSEAIALRVTEARTTVVDILNGRDRRLIAVVGPCSIHDPKAALDYAARLAALAKEIEQQIFIVMRVYFEKPRTTIGWKGLINDPDLNKSHQISKGLGVARSLMLTINGLGLPVAGEMLDPITPHYLADLITWGAIGARTTESQTHREMVSGLSFPVGFKNGTDGNLQIAIDAMKTANHPHTFLGINNEGQTSIVHTLGNQDVHVVLRGGNDTPNYSPDDIRRTEEMLAKAGVPKAIMVDCSHANSYKDHTKQEAVLDSIVEQIVAGNDSIRGIMLESFLKAGNQSLTEPDKLEYGLSITDKCVDWDNTERMLREAAQRLANR